MPHDVQPPLGGMPPASSGKGEGGGKRGGGGDVGLVGKSEGLDAVKDKDKDGPDKAADKGGSESD